MLLYLLEDELIGADLEFRQCVQVLCVHDFTDNVTRVCVASCRELKLTHCI